MRGTAPGGDPHDWTVEQVVEWGRSKGWDEGSVVSKFVGECFEEKRREVRRKRRQLVPEAGRMMELKGQSKGVGILGLIRVVFSFGPKARSLQRRTETHQARFFPPSLLRIQNMRSLEMSLWKWTSTSSKKLTSSLSVSDSR